MKEERIIFHIDVNNAFLSWTAVDMLRRGATEDIRNIPSVIGGDEDARRGIVVAKSPVAKKYGVKTAETLYQARRKCPGLKVFPANHELYKRESDKLYQYYLQFTPTVERFSVDECFLDMTGTHYLYDDLIRLAYQMKDEIHEKFGITVNVGIANNRLCAKMASDFEKPNKVHTLFASEVEEKMWPLDVGDLLFIGKRSAETLKALGIHTIGELAKTDVSLLTKYFKSNAIYMHNASLGIDDTPVTSERAERKRISTTATLPFDVTDKSYIRKMLLSQADEVGLEAREKKLYATSIAIIIRTDAFVNYSHQCKLENPTNVSEDIFKKAYALFERAWKGEPIRLIGIRLGNFVKTNMTQISLFDTDTVDDGSSKVQEAVDQIRSKFGKDIIMPASLKEEGSDRDGK